MEAKPTTQALEGKKRQYTFVQLSLTMPIYDGSCLVYNGRVKITAFHCDSGVFFKTFCDVFYGTQYFWRHCSVHNTIVILLTRFDAAIPRPHCIVGLVFYGLKCGLKYRKMRLNKTPTWCNKMQTLLLQTFFTCFGRHVSIIRSIKYWHGSHRYR